MSGAWRSALLVVLVGVGGCACGCNDDCKRVKSVEVVPPEVRTTPGASFALSAVARDAEGRVILAALPTKWTGDVAFIDPTVSPVQVTTAGVGNHHAGAKIGDVDSDDASIIITAADAGPPTVDAIEIEHAAGDEPADVIVDANAAGDAPGCGGAQDRQYTVAGVAALPLNLIGGCSNEVAIFAKNRAPLIEKLGAAQWTTGFERLTRTTLPTPITLPVRIWYYVMDPDAKTRALEHLDHAAWIFGFNRAGVVPGVLQHHEMGVSETYGPFAACDDIEASLPGFKPDVGEFHIVYVQDITSLAEHTGYACVSADDRGDVVVLSYARGVLSTLGHEISHQLGMSAPPFPFMTAGHVNDYPTSEGFTAANIMWDHESLGSGDGRIQLTLGQLYRMHVDKRSWMNRSGLRASGHTEDCQAAHVLGTCPRLGHDRGKP